MLRSGLLFLTLTFANIGPLFAQMAYFDPSGRLLNSHQRSICGQDDMIGMEKLGEPYQRIGRPVGLYMIGSKGACTGSLISKDLFLTARHCARKCDEIKVKFGYYPGSPTQTYACQEIVEKGGNAMNEDYMIIRLAGEPGKVWGWYGVTARPLQPEQQLLMIHHPAAKPMKVSKNECAVQKEQDGMLHHRCDTLPGSSGSSILLRDTRTIPSIKITGVHGYGGCRTTGDTSSNSGPSMTQLIKLSPILRALAADEIRQLRQRYSY